MIDPPGYLSGYLFDPDEMLGTVPDLPNVVGEHRNVPEDQLPPPTASGWASLTPCGIRPR